MRRLIFFLLFLWPATAALVISARAASVLHVYNTAGLPGSPPISADPPPGTYSGNFYDFAGEQTFSDADGWQFDFSSPFLPQINFRVTRPDYTQQGYYGQSGTFNPPFTPGAPSPPFTVGDYAGGHNFPVVGFDGLSCDSTKLQILGISFDPTSGAVTSLAADFAEAAPNYPERVLYAQLRYNSDISLGAGHPYVCFDQAAYSASKSDDGVVVTVQRQGGTDSAVSANYSVAGGTATAGVDYTPVAGTLTWAAGETAPKTVYVPILKNSLLESARTLNLLLTGDSVFAAAQTTITIAQDPLPPSLLHFHEYGFGVQDTTRTSDQGFTFQAIPSDPGTVFPDTYFTVESTPGDGPLQGEELTFYGQRLVVGNYTAAPDSAGYGTKTGFEFNGAVVLENVGSEDWQILEVNYGADGSLLQLAANFEVLDKSGKPLVRGEIRYHSTLPLRGTVELSSTAFAGNKSASQVQLTAVRQGDTSEKISVGYATTNYSALAGSDYAAAQGKLTWAAGESGPKTFTVPVLHNPAGGNRVFFVDLSGKSLGNNASAAVTIVDDSQPSTALLPEPSGQIDTKYPLLVSNSSEVYIGVIYPLPDGGALIGGNFGLVGGRTQNGIVRLDAAGEPDFSFGSPLSYSIEPAVNAITVQTDGKVLVGGHFSVGSGPGVVNLVRLNPDGSLDTSFKEAASVGGGSTISSVVLQPDGKILVGGEFSAGSGLARLNPDGSLDNSFIAPELAYLDGHPRVLLQPDGKVLAMDDYGMLKRYNADGSVDTAYVAYDGPFSSAANASILQPDGKLVVIGSASVGGLLRLNRDGTLDTGFDPTDPNETGGFGGPVGLRGVGLQVGSLALQSDGKLLVGGSSQSGAPLARLNPDGTLDSGFTASTDLPAAVGAMALEADGCLLVSAGYLSTGGKNIVHTVFAKLSGTFQRPAVTVAANVSEAGGANGQVGQFQLTIPTAQSTDLTVTYQVKGTGINGTDYAYLKGSAKIKAGKTSKVIKVVPQGNLGGAASKTVKLVLSPSFGYAVGTANKAKVTIHGLSH